MSLARERQTDRCWNDQPAERRCLGDVVGKPVLLGAKILVVGHNFLAAEDLKSGLEAEGATVCGPFSSSEEALDLLDLLQPDCTLLEIFIRGRDGRAVGRATSKAEDSLCGHQRLSQRRRSKAEAKRLLRREAIPSTRKWFAPRCWLCMNSDSDEISLRAYRARLSENELALKVRSMALSQGCLW